jgi:hypothetical protein
VERVLSVASPADLEGVSRTANKPRGCSSGWLRGPPPAGVAAQKRRFELLSLCGPNSYALVDESSTTPPWTRNPTAPPHRPDCGSDAFGLGALLRRGGEPETDADCPKPGSSPSKTGGNACLERAGSNCPVAGQRFTQMFTLRAALSDDDAQGEFLASLGRPLTSRPRSDTLICREGGLAPTPRSYALL